MALCNTCMGCIRGSRKPLEGQSCNGRELWFYHHRRLFNLHLAVKDGCPLCAAFWERITVLRRLTEDEGNRLDACGELLECCLAKREEDASVYGEYLLYFFFSEKLHDIIGLLERGGPLIGFAFFPSDGEFYTTYLLSQEASKRIGIVDTCKDFGSTLFSNTDASTTGSEETVQLATCWMNECLTKHISCNDESRDEWYPTRLLDLGSPQAPDGSIRLVISNFDNVEGPYITLSHCWGQVEMLTLTKGNITQLRSGIPMTSLPLTFREAAHVASRLGVRYLWIDSLCIIQGNEEDWLAESSRMGHVYAHALCNIAATASKNAGEGLFRNRDPAKLYRIECDTSLCGSTLVRRYTILVQDFWEKTLIETPLNQRAWVAQERLLAPRILQYTANELVWECRELEACESYPDGLPNQVMRTGIIRKHLWRLGTNLRNDVERASAHELWSRFHYFYSKCQLTRPMDRLIAIAGVAKKFQMLTNDEYIAGMWSQNLARQITWSTHAETYDACIRLTSPLAQRRMGPSFSWASTSEASLFSYWTDSTLNISISDIQLQCKHGNPFGIIESGSLHLHGTMKRVRIRRIDIPGNTRYRWSIYYPNPEVEEKDQIITDRVSVDHLSSDLDDLSKQGRAFVMTTSTGPWRGEGRIWCEFLILGLLNAGEARYHRVGMVRTHLGKVQSALLMAVQKDERSIPSLKYEPAAEQPHTILLV